MYIPPISQASPASRLAFPELADEPTKGLHIRRLFGRVGMADWMALYVVNIWSVVAHRLAVLQKTHVVDFHSSSDTENYNRLRQYCRSKQRTFVALTELATLAYK